MLAAALEGLELQRKRIDDQIAMVRGMLSGRKSVASSPAAEKSSAAPSRRKRVLSEEARLRIAAAQKKRWAAFRKVKKSE
ncbi:MAG: hypothetical protein K2Z81_28285 [Cyanobacteria bacterium]|nr:hypothetical protein [Cyanobacteriota bacterium]